MIQDQPTRPPGASGASADRSEHEVAILARMLFSGMRSRGYKVRQVISFCNVLLGLAIEHSQGDKLLSAGSLGPAAQPLTGSAAATRPAQEVPPHTGR